MSPANALRCDEILDSANLEIEKLRIELNGKKITHAQFMQLVKERGIHERYYRYQKPEPTGCMLCRYGGFH